MKFSSIDFAQLLSDLFYCKQCKQCLADYRQTNLCNVLRGQKELNISPKTFYTDYPFIAAYIKCKFSYAKCSECVFQIENNSACTCMDKKGCQVIDNEMEHLMRSGQEWEILNSFNNNPNEDAQPKATIAF